MASAAPADFDATLASAQAETQRLSSVLSAAESQRDAAAAEASRLTADKSVIAADRDNATLLLHQAKAALDASRASARTYEQQEKNQP